MGWSAGGHLALLYAYDTAGNYNRAEENPIKLVISEAGPTDLYAAYEGDSYGLYTNIFKNLLGNVQENDGDWYKDLSKVSSATIASAFTDKSILPFTILAYGNGLSATYNNYGDENQNGLLDDGDNLIPFSQATAIYSVLGESKCSLFELCEVEHTEFGEGANGILKIMHPESTESGAWDQAREDYYEKLQDELAFL